MKPAARYILLPVAVILLSACAQNTRRSPALSKATESPDAPEKKSLLSRTADTTWNVVTAPTRWVAPKPHAATGDQETFEPADAYISIPTDSPPDTQPH